MSGDEQKSNGGSQAGPQSPNAGGSLFLPPSPDAGGPADPEQLRRQQIRDTLLQEARDDFSTIAGSAETAYSRDLEQVQRQINVYLKKDPSFYPQAVVLDPAQFDAATALGFGPTEAARQVLARQGLQLDPEKNGADAASLATIGGNAQQVFDSRFGIKMYTHDAFAESNIGAANPAYVLLPPPDHAIEWPIKGLTPAEYDDFVNGHEGWHIKDSRYSMQQFSPEAAAKAADYHAADIAADSQVRAAYLMKYRKETFADTGSLGDMIREGHGLGIIDRVSAWRADDPQDGQHLSVPVLAGLKTEIERMGINRFRQLSDHDAKNLYYDVAEKYGLSDKGLEAAARYDARPQSRAALAAAAKTDPSTQEGLAFRAAVDTPVPAASPNLLSPGEAQLKAALDAFDAGGALQDRAFAVAGKITPATLVQAYGAMQSELHDKLKAEPQNRLYDLEMSKLQMALIQNVQTLDYVAANASRGVAIEKAEPSLSKFALTTPPAAAAPSVEALQDSPVPVPAKAPALKL